MSIEVLSIMVFKFPKKEFESLGAEGLAPASEPRTNCTILSLAVCAMDSWDVPTHAATSANLWVLSSDSASKTAAARSAILVASVAVSSWSRSAVTWVMSLLKSEMAVWTSSVCRREVGTDTGAANVESGRVKARIAVMVVKENIFEVGLCKDGLEVV